MDQDRAVELPAQPPRAEVESQADEPEAPVMLTDAMCGLACQIRPETPLA